jgi:hypothetical protein
MFQPYHGENKLYICEMMMISALYLINTLSSSIRVLQAHWNNSLWVDI